MMIAGVEDKQKLLSTLQFPLHYLHKHGELSGREGEDRSTTHEACAYREVSQERLLVGILELTAEGAELHHRGGG